jgi:D-xylose transport system ATP-binding protein
VGFRMTAPTALLRKEHEDAIHMSEPVLSLAGISKQYAAVRALDNVNFEVWPGEVVALVGDNGAGKSTLVKVISGVAPADEGSIKFDGVRCEIQRPHDATSLGIATVFQDLALCENLDVAANLYLGQESIAWRVGSGLRWLDEIEMESRTRRLLQTLSVKIPDVRAPVELLSGGQRQAVAITRALLGEPKVVLLDEPTAALGVEQTALVLDLVDQLRERGLGVVLISHNLADVFEIADRAVVLRLGKNNGSFSLNTATTQDVVAAITGGAGAQRRRPSKVPREGES